MPTYEYVCKECGEHLEAVQAFSDPPLTTCAACGGTLRKVFGNVGIVFKGSGFYKTDSRTSASGSNGSPKAGASSDGGGEKPADAGSGSAKEATSSSSTSTESSSTGSGTSSTSSSAASKS